MKTGTLLLLGGIALLAVKSGALGKLSSTVADTTPFGGSGNDPVDSPIDKVVLENKQVPPPSNSATGTWYGYPSKPSQYILDKGYPIPGSGEVGNI